MQDIIQQILDIYRGFSEKQLENRRIEPTTQAAINEWEAAIGEALPQDYREFLLLNTHEFSIAFNYQMLSLEHAKDCWQMMVEHLDNGVFNDGRIEHHEKGGYGNWDDKRLQKQWWSRAWIPFAEDSCGNMYCIDLAPGEKGQLHQIISMEVQDGQGPFWNNMFHNFTDCLLKNLSYLQNGKYELEDYGNGVFMPSIDPYM